MWPKQRVSLIAQLVKKKSAYNAGDPSPIPGSGRSAGEGIGYPLQYSCASLVVQLVKNPPAMRETWARSLGWEDPLEKGKATHSSVLAWRISRTVYPSGHQESPKQTNKKKEKSKLGGNLDKRNKYKYLVKGLILTGVM